MPQFYHNAHHPNEFYLKKRPKPCTFSKIYAHTQKRVFSEGKFSRLLSRRMALALAREHPVFENGIRR
jgi:hypothetical protein